MAMLCRSFARTVPMGETGAECMAEAEGVANGMNWRLLLHVAAPLSATPCRWMTAKKNWKRASCTHNTKCCDEDAGISRTLQTPRSSSLTL